MFPRQITRATTESEAVMDVRRKANREDHEITLQYKTRREAMLVDELNEDRLTQLLAFIDRLQQTPPGMPSCDTEPKSSANASGWRAKRRSATTASCGIGSTGICRRPNRVAVVRG